LGHVEVPDLSASVFDNEEAVQQLERHRRDGEEVEGSDRLAVIGEKGQPLLARVTAAPNTPQIPGYGSFGDGEAELQEFTVDPGRTPGRILFCQAAEERTDFNSGFRSAATRS
jgi:hypothetical protein